MKAIIYSSQANGFIKSIASKSILHRAIILASLAKGTSVLSNVTLGDDLLRTIDACRIIGANINQSSDKLIIEGIGLNNKSINSIKFKTNMIDVNESASTLRFLIPLFSLFEQTFTFKCAHSLATRPMDTYLDLYGKGLKRVDDSFIVSNSLLDDRLAINVDKSSQFITGLLIESLFRSSPRIIELVGDVVSKSYIDMTISLIKEFGGNISVKDNIISINPTEYLCCKDYIIEEDFSNLANYLCLGAINGNVSTEFTNNSIQGDSKIIELLDDAGANIKISNDGIVVSESTLKGFNLSIINNPDLAPILFAIAGICKNESIFYDTKRLANKESNRLFSMKNELLKLGIEMIIEQEIVRIIPTNVIRYSEELDSHNDHRVCMALCVLSTLSSTPVTINGVECVNKSNPNFFNDLKSLGIKIDLI